MLKSVTYAFGVVSLVAGGFAHADSSCATSAVFKVNSVASGERRSADVFVVNYAPEWSLGYTNDGARVVISKVEHADTVKAVTNVVATGEPGAGGTVNVLPGSTGLASCRLIHRVEIGGEPVGETLVSDVAIGVESPLSSAAFADSRTNSLQCVAEAGEVALLTYSTEWVTNGTPAQVVLTKVCDRYQRGALQSSATTELSRASAPADGVFNFLPGPEMGGTFSLRCEFLDSSGNPLDVGEATYRFKEKWGNLLIVY